MLTVLDLIRTGYKSFNSEMHLECKMVEFWRLVALFFLINNLAMRAYTKLLII